MKFSNREEAGKMLADQLAKYQKIENGIVLGLPRGGVVLAFEVAKKLKLPLDIIVVRKIGAPGDPEFAIGVVDEEGEAFLNKAVLKYYGISQEFVDEQKVAEEREVSRRLKMYRGNRPLLSLKNATVILVDDGIATGFTMMAAVKLVKSKGAQRVIVAVPVAPLGPMATLRREVDEVVVLNFPSMFTAVGEFYQEFPQISDKEVINLLYEKAL